MKTLKEIQQYLNSIPYINEGGCGISAYAMYLWLNKNKLINKSLFKKSFKFVLLYRSYSEDFYINNQNVLRNHSGNAVAPAHMVIYYNNKYLDSTGVVDISEYKWVQHVTDEWFIQNCINNIITWNNSFDRKHVPQIESMLNIELNILK